MDQPTSVERRLVIVLLVIACVAIGGVLAILPYRLYSRDVQQATTDAHRLSSVVHAALSHALMQEDLDPTALSDLTNRLQGLTNVQIRMRRLEEGEVHPVVASGKGSSTRRDTELTYVAPPIVDRQGHTWLATMDFDLSLMKRRSIRLISDLIIAVALGSLAFSAAIFLLVRRALLQPIRSVTARIGAIADGADMTTELELPEFDTAEMRALAREIERACAVRGAA